MRSVLLYIVWLRYHVLLLIRLRKKNTSDGTLWQIKTNKPSDDALPVIGVKITEKLEYIKQTSMLNTECG